MVSNRSHIPKGRYGPPSTKKTRLKSFGGILRQKAVHAPWCYTTHEESPPWEGI